MTLCRAILSIRKSTGWTQSEFADAMDVSPRTISDWELYDKSPNMEKIAMLIYISRQHGNDEAEGVLADILRKYIESLYLYAYDTPTPPLDFTLPTRIN